MQSELMVDRQEVMDVLDERYKHEQRREILGGGGG